LIQQQRVTGEGENRLGLQRLTPKIATDPAVESATLGVISLSHATRVATPATVGHQTNSNQIPAAQQNQRRGARH
jgi:hypothetical protein